MPEKECRDCGVQKPLSEFPKHPQMGDGHLHSCKMCRSEYAKRWYKENRNAVKKRVRGRYHENKDDINARQRERYAKDPAYRAHIRENNKRTRDPERERAAHRRYYRENKKEFNRKVAEWGRKHPELRAEYQRRMRARKKGAAVITLTMDEWREICERFDHKCAYCGSENDIEMDHQIPIQRGGGHDATNVVPCCQRCNRSKNNRTPAEWLAGNRRPSA